MMKFPHICAVIFLSGFGGAFAETLDEAVGRFLAGEAPTQQEVDSITDRYGVGPMVNGQRNNGTTYLHHVKRSIVDPVRNGGWPLGSEHVMHERQQAKTYRALKAIYEKEKTPLVAFALVCPAMYVNDFDLLPELIAKIGENKFLKARFDVVYAKRWKPHLDPDF